MGQAKRRGTFEERKAAAVELRRIETERREKERQAERDRLVTYQARQRGKSRINPALMLALIGSGAYLAEQEKPAPADGESNG